MSPDHLLQITQCDPVGVFPVGVPPLNYRRRAPVGVPTARNSESLNAQWHPIAEITVLIAVVADAGEETIGPGQFDVEGNAIGEDGMEIPRDKVSASP